MILHNTENAALLYIGKSDFLYATIVGFSNNEEIKMAADQIKAKIRHIRAERILVDTSKLGVLRSNDFNTIRDTIVPLLREVGLKKVAFLKPDNSFGHLNVLKFLTFAQTAEARIFNDMDSAEKWLMV